MLVGYHVKPINHHIRDQIVSQVHSVLKSQQHYPSIVGVYFVSTSKLHHDVKHLRAHIYDVACDFKTYLGW